MWAAAGLRRMGLAPVEVVLPDELALDARLVHHVGTDGASVELRLRRGLTVRAEDLRGVLNRMVGVPQAALGPLAPIDRDYVAEELQAALVSWLAGLACPVLNRPTPGFLCGPWRPPSGWRWLAARVGLPARPWRLASWDEPEPPDPAERRVALVVAGEVAGPVPDGLAPGCVALAEAAGATLLGVVFASGADGAWRVDDATPLPELRHGGRGALEALLRAFQA